MSTTTSKQPRGIVWLAVWMVGLVFGWMPGWMVRGLGWVLGVVWFYAVPVRRRLMLAHLRVAGGFGALDAWRIGRGVLVTQARNVVRMLGWRRLLRGKGGVLVEGQAHLEAALAQGRGVLLVSAHLGAFDWVACQQAKGGLRLHVISKRLSWGALDRVWMEVRGGLGLNILPPEAPLPPAMEALRRGEVVLLVLDQHSPEPKAVEGDFMGVAARTSAALALLALRTKAPVVPCFTVWEGSGHRLWFEAPIKPPDAHDLRERVQGLTQACLRVLEGVIFRYPEQWLWLHRRWKDAQRRPLICAKDQRQDPKRGAGDV